jgi:hypothetical protein
MVVHRIGAVKSSETGHSSRIPEKKRRAILDRPCCFLHSVADIRLLFTL